MKFSVDIPVKIISGRGCVASHPEELKLGQHAAIVCGKRSAVKSGALGDVVRMLGSLGIGRDILDGALPNPPLAAAAAMGQRASALGADFVIGIGGGEGGIRQCAVKDIASDAE